MGVPEQEKGNKTFFKKFAKRTKNPEILRRHDSDEAMHEYVA